MRISRRLTICMRISWNLFDNLLEGMRTLWQFLSGYKDCLTISQVVRRLFRGAENSLIIFLRVWKRFDNRPETVWKPFDNLDKGLKTTWQSPWGYEHFLAICQRVCDLTDNLPGCLKTLCQSLKGCEDSFFANLSKGVKTLCQSLKGCEDSLLIS